MPTTARAHALWTVRFDAPRSAHVSVSQGTRRHGRVKAHLPARAQVQLPVIADTLLGALRAAMAEALLGARRAAMAEARSAVWLRSLQH